MTTISFVAGTRRYKTRSKTKSKIKSSLLVAKEDDLEDDELEGDNIVESKNDGLEGEIIVESKDDEVEGDTIVDRTHKNYYTAISPNPHLDPKIEPFEVSMVYGVSINGSIVITRHMDTIFEWPTLSSKRRKSRLRRRRLRKGNL